MLLNVIFNRSQNEYAFFFYTVHYTIVMPEL